VGRSARSKTGRGVWRARIKGDGQEKGGKCVTKGGAPRRADQEAFETLKGKRGIWRVRREAKGDHDT